MIGVSWTMGWKVDSSEGVQNQEEDFNRGLIYKNDVEGVEEPHNIEKNRDVV